MLWELVARPHSCTIKSNKICLKLKKLLISLCWNLLGLFRQPSLALKTENNIMKFNRIMKVKRMRILISKKKKRKKKRLLSSFRPSFVMAMGSVCVCGGGGGGGGGRGRALLRLKVNTSHPPSLEAKGNSKPQELFPFVQMAENQGAVLVTP